MAAFVLSRGILVDFVGTNGIDVTSARFMTSANAAHEHLFDKNGKCGQCGEVKRRYGRKTLKAWRKLFITAYGREPTEEELSSKGGFDTPPGVSGRPFTVFPEFEDDEETTPERDAIRKQIEDALR